MKNFGTLIMAIALITACVPPTRFKALQSETLTCQEERDLLKAENERLTVENKETKAHLAKAEKELARAVSDTLEWKEEASRLNRQNSQLTNDYSDLQEAQRALMKGSEVEIRKLMQEMNERNARLAELEQVLQQQESVLVSLREKVSDALLGFENQGLTVSRKNGKVYVSLDEKLLFKSGSTTVDPKGAMALKNLAKVLEQNLDINVIRA